MGLFTINLRAARRVFYLFPAPNSRRGFWGLALYRANMLMLFLHMSLVQLLISMSLLMKFLLLACIKADVKQLLLTKRDPGCLLNT